MGVARRQRWTPAGVRQGERGPEAALQRGAGRRERRSGQVEWRGNVGRRSANSPRSCISPKLSQINSLGEILADLSKPVVGQRALLQNMYFGACLSDQVAAFFFPGFILFFGFEVAILVLGHPDTSYCLHICIAVPRKPNDLDAYFLSVDGFICHQ